MVQSQSVVVAVEIKKKNTWNSFHYRWLLSISSPAHALSRGAAQIIHHPPPRGHWDLNAAAALLGCFRWNNNNNNTEIKIFWGAFFHLRDLLTIISTIEVSLYVPPYEQTLFSRWVRWLSVWWVRRLTYYQSILINTFGQFYYSMRR